MFCTPPATTRSWVPDMTPWAAKCTACCEEPHWRSMVTPGTWSGSPATSHAVRATSPAWEPMVSQQPEDHVVDRARVDAGAVAPGRSSDVRAEVGGVHAGQRAAALADRGADGVDDEGLRSLR